MAAGPLRRSQPAGAEKASDYNHQSKSIRSNRCKHQESVCQRRAFFVRYRREKLRALYFFTGETKQGGKWYNGRYDYLHLPLDVRENTILPVGSCRTRPDYAYEHEVMGESVSEFMKHM